MGLTGRQIHEVIGGSYGSIRQFLWQIRHPEEHKTYVKQQTEKNKEKYKEWRREYYQKNKEYENERSKNYWHDHDYAYRRKCRRAGVEYVPK